MRKLFLAATALAALAAPANAASIWKTKMAGIQGPVVFVKGDIQEGDDVNFRNVTANLPANRTLVVLTSDGGEIGPGINIGEIIRAKRFSTIALNVCASTCGLMWLAGVPRGAFTDSGVGFHAVYDKDDGKPVSGGNAVVGAYLTRLGFRYDTIYYLTKTAPASMEWLNADKAKQYGISFRLLPSS